MNIKSLFFSFIILASFPAQAALDIEISGGSAQQIPIAVVPFDQSSASKMKEDIAGIVSADLARSGLFRILETRGMPNKPSNVSQIKLADWTALQAQAVVVGKVEAVAGGRYKATFQLVDAVKEAKLADMNFQLTPSQARTTARYFGK